MANGLGLIKISMFPGMVGIDVAKSISAAIRELAPDRLIVDLRGNTGGGMGCLRVMSYLFQTGEASGTVLRVKGLKRALIRKPSLCSTASLPRNLAFYH